VYILGERVLAEPWYDLFLNGAMMPVSCARFECDQLMMMPVLRAHFERD
jgi:hypothetical protein